MITTVCGGGIYGFSGDGGPATAAQTNGLFSLLFDAGGNLLVTDYGNKRIRKIDTSGIIRTIAGNGNWEYVGDGMIDTLAQFDPFYISLDNNGNLFIADYSNNRIRKIDTNRIIHTVVGTGIGGYNGDGIQATIAQIHMPDGITTDQCNNIYISDIDNYRIRKVTFDTSCRLNNTGVKYILTLAMFSLFPNPTTSTLTINTNIPIENILIINYLGKEVLSQKMVGEQTDLDIGNLQYGVYFLEVVSKDGERIIRKFMKE